MLKNHARGANGKELKVFMRYRFQAGSWLVQSTMSYHMYRRPVAVSQIMNPILQEESEWEEDNGDVEEEDENEEEFWV